MIGERRVIGIVPARAGSQRLPGKNVRSMAGQPMIGWTLDAARDARVLDHVVVSSDDEAVLAVAAERGVEAVRRPVALAGPDASVIDAVEHVLKSVGGEWDYVVLLQPTSPLRTAADIDGAVSLCDETDAPAVLGVSPLPKPVDFYDRLGPGGRLSGAPDLTGVTLINGAIYVAKTPLLLSDRTFRLSGARGFVMPAERGWDVDEITEFMVCEALLSKLHSK